MIDRSGKRRLWIYASILFTCIFLILLISAYSQIKFDKNIENYRLKLSEQENLKLESEINLKTAMEEIRKLKEGASEIRTQSEAGKKQLEEEKKKHDELEKQLKEKTDGYEKLIQANEFLNKNQIIDGVLFLKIIKPSTLNIEGQKLYSQLLSSSIKEASEGLYIQGYEAYNKRKYEQAIELFKKSMGLEVKEYYNDECVFLSGLCYYNLKDNVKAAEFFKRLIKDYPQSGYINEANRLLKVIG